MGARLASRGFTLIELLIVIGVLAVLSVAVVVTLNPAELLRQARDATRLSDLATLNRAINIASFDASGGAPNIIYVSIPDPVLTSPQTSLCPNLGLPSAPTGWSYRCVSQEDLRKTNSTGWVPINFQAFSAGSPLSALPIDPVNTAASGFYYTYVTGGSYMVTALLESQKYLTQSATRDGGSDNSRIELGNDTGLWAGASGLVGFWKFENDFTDSSGRNNHGVGSGGATFATGKVGQAGVFDGIDNYVSSTSNSSLTPPNSITVEAWANPTDFSVVNAGIVSKRDDDGAFNHSWGGMWVEATTGKVWGRIYEADNGQATFNVANALSNAALPAGQWSHVVIVANASSSPKSVNLYVNGERAYPSLTYDGTLRSGTYPMFIGKQLGGYFKGLIDEARIYNRALSETEIKGSYNATK